MTRHALCSSLASRKELSAFSVTQRPFLIFSSYRKQSVLRIRPSASNTRLVRPRCCDGLFCRPVCLTEVGVFESIKRSRPQELRIAHRSISLLFRLHLDFPPCAGGKFKQDLLRGLRRETSKENTQQILILRLILRHASNGAVKPPKSLKPQDRFYLGHRGFDQHTRDTEIGETF